MSLSLSKILVTVLLVTFSGTYFTRDLRSGMVVRGFYDPSIQGNTSAQYWKQLSFTPYFSPLLIVLIIVQLPTLLLLLYPIRAFRRLLTHCGSSRYHAISVFMDAFQGHYKDGTNGSRDYRAASSISFLLRTLFCVILSGSKSRNALPTHSLSKYLSLVYCLVIVSLFYGVVQPCKQKHKNMIECVVYCVAGWILLSLGAPLGHRESHTHSLSHDIGIYFGLYASLMLLVLPSLILLATCLAKISMCLCCIHGNKLIKTIKKVLKRDTDALLPQNLPDRLENPQEYMSL